MSRMGRLAVAVTLVVAFIAPGVPAAAAGGAGRPKVTPLATVASGPCTDDICSTGSTLGPDGALYVTDSTAGRIQRVDLRRGSVTTYADGLPPAISGVVGGGVTDVAFVDRTAYVLVTGVSRFWTDLIGSSNAPAVEGIYRLDRVGSGRTRTTLVADLYTWSERHPPATAIFVPGGFTYAMQPHGRGFLVTDGHHNRVLQVALDGHISVYVDFGQNIVPTGLESVGKSVLIGQAGPVPHTPETGLVVALRRKGGRVIPVATGAPLLVDVEVGPRHKVYGLAQGAWPYEGQPGKEGFPAAPDSGELMVADRRGHFRTVVSGLDRPTTFEVIGRTAFVVTITGRVLKVSGLGRR